MFVPTLEDFSTLMRLLPRSATGQSISNYVSLLTGTRRPGDQDGPEKTVFILVDNGRAYGWVYPGPMGSVLTPLYTGIENALDLPHASTGCNQCGVVCPVRIPLPKLMHGLRETQIERGLRPWRERLALRAWAWIAGKPALYRWLSRRAVRYLRWLADGDGRIRVLGLAPGWTDGRDLAAGSGKTFHELN